MNKTVWTCPPVAKLADTLGQESHNAKLVRQVWKAETVAQVIECLLPSSLAGWVYDFANSGFLPPTLLEVKRATINALGNYCGVEYLGIKRETNQPIYYCNAGDTYTQTIVFCGTRLFLACWGVLVEERHRGA